MEKNVGRLDSRIRRRIGSILLLIGLAGLFGLLQIGRVLEIVFVVLGLIFFATALTNKCGLYALFGIDTRKDKN